jgi:hypothetical protein
LTAFWQKNKDQGINLSFILQFFNLKDLAEGINPLTFVLHFFS